MMIEEHPALQSSQRTGKSTATDSERTNSTQSNAHAIGLYAVLAFCIPIIFLLTMWNIALRKRIKSLQDDHSKGNTQSPRQDLDYEVIGYTNLQFESDQQSRATTADSSQREVANNGSNNNAVYMELGPRCKDEQTYTPLSGDKQTTSPYL
ncbi:uncharacterized protein LOC135684272 [Rhopilema esculentum]|uniref:uncharacterized protein LOC135684272 n=1 Tax=Rhopilema esculentum TaxID=499914 RepID=UPI0031DBAE0E